MTVTAIIPLHPQFRREPVLAARSASGLPGTTE